MVRDDHSYVNLPSSLMEVVGICAQTIFRNGSYIYSDKKDFVMRAIQNLIETERKNNQQLSSKIKKYDLERIIKDFNDTRYACGTLPMNKISGGNKRKNV